MIDPALRARYAVQLDAAIGQSVGNGCRFIMRAPDGAEVFAEPWGDGVVWGVNDAAGEVLLRGRRLFDGSDVET